MKGGDIAVVGGGIVGASTAAALARKLPDARVLLVEKEKGLAAHQTGRNSGVIHSGIYYPPGSLKAQLCRAGCRDTKAFCDRHGIAYEERGKLLVATDDDELERLGTLEERAGHNGVEVTRLGPQQLRNDEARVAGVGALLIPSAAIVDFGAVTRALAGELEANGGEVHLGTPVERIERTGNRWRIQGRDMALEVDHVVACGGLQSDRLARMAGIEPSVRIVPFKGEYYVLPEARKDFVRRLVYPVPDPRSPFLGVHVTPMIDGTITVGPNAVLSLAREGYGKRSISPGDAWDALTFPGLWSLLFQYRHAVASELAGTLSRRVYLKALQKYCPDLALSDLTGYRCGIRAQAVDRKGNMVGDFLVEENDGITMVLNAPSPAATSSLPIGEHVARVVIGETSEVA